MQAFPLSRKAAGLTLIELMVVIAVLSILLLAGVPALQRSIDNRRVIGAADNIITSLRYAQSESIKRNTTLPITFISGANWSYTLPTIPPVTVSGAEFRGTSLTVSAASNTLTFDPKRGTILEAPVAAEVLLAVTSASGTTIGVEIDPLSRIQLCSTNGFGGYPTCP